jgi:sulfide:quinone oxidoreductase
MNANQHSYATDLLHRVFGHRRVARVEVTFRSGERPNGQFDEPSGLLLADKAEFGTSRVQRWFGRDWSSY